MQALFTFFRVIFGMKDMMWESNLERDAAPSSGTYDVIAAEGPVNPPRP